MCFLSFGKEAAPVCATSIAFPGMLGALYNLTVINHHLTHKRASQYRATPGTRVVVNTLARATEHILYTETCTHTHTHRGGHLRGHLVAGRSLECFLLFESVQCVCVCVYVCVFVCVCTLFQEHCQEQGEVLAFIFRCCLIT